MKAALLTLILLSNAACSMNAWIARGPRPAYDPGPYAQPVYYVSPVTGQPVAPPVVSRGTLTVKAGKVRKP